MRLLPKKIIGVKCFHLCCVLLILILALTYWNKLGLITIVDDEFGYWGCGAQMAGLDWKELLSQSDYYSYGYGIILSMLFRLGIEARVMFKIAVAINILLLISSFEMALYAGKELFPDVDKYFLIGAACMVTLFSNNVYQIFMGAPETLLYFLFWCITISLLHVVRKRRPVDLVCLVGVTAYIYMVHGRSIGVVLGVLITLVFLAILWHKEKYGKELFCGAVILVILFLLGEYAREWIIKNWFQNNQGVSPNDYSGLIIRISSIFSIKGLVIFFLSIVGKVFSPGIGGFLFPFLVITLGIQKLWLSIKKKQVDIHENLILWFLVLAFIAELLINAIHKNAHPRELIAGRIMMGRYTDFVLGPILMYAICRIRTGCVKKWETAMCAAVFGVCTIITAIQITYAGSNGIIDFNNMDIAFWIRLLPEGYIGIVLMGVIAIAVFCFCQRAFVNKKAGVVCVLVIGLFWGIAGKCSVNSYLDIKQEKAAKYLYPIEEFTKNYDMETEFFYIKDERDQETKMEYVKLLQFLQPERKFTVINLEEIDNWTPSEDCLIISGVEESTVEKLEERWELLVESERLCIYK